MKNVAEEQQQACVISVRLYTAVLVLREYVLYSGQQSLCFLIFLN